VRLVGRAVGVRLDVLLHGRGFFGAMGGDAWMHA
jgi:hypothetical protein